jgi:hypothetical protein
MIRTTLIYYPVIKSLELKLKNPIALALTRKRLFMVSFPKRLESHEADMNSFDTMSVYVVNTSARTSNDHEQVSELIVTNVPHTEFVTTPSHSIDHIRSESPQQTLDSVASNRSKTTGGMSSDYAKRV